MQHSVNVNDELRAAVADESCDYRRIQKILSDKRKANQRLRNTNRFAKSENVTAYLIADEEWINRLAMISHRMKANDVTLGAVHDFVNENTANEASLNARQHNILTAFDEVLGDIAANEAKVAETA